jgi:hypothetical protein
MSIGDRLLIKVSATKRIIAAPTGTKPKLKDMFHRLNFCIYIPISK